MSGGSVKDVKSKGDLDKLLQEASPLVLHFWAAWCDASKHMDKVLSHLATDFPHARFFKVEAEEQPDISEAYSVSSVPYFVFFKDGIQVDTLEGADPSSLANKVAKVAGSLKHDEAAAPASLGLAAAPSVLETVRDLARDHGSSAAVPSGNLNERLELLINSYPVMLFMKGNPDAPKCGFSKKVVEILEKENVKFGSFDILEDQEVREGLKKLSNWPTYPQLYCKGELLGGSDIAIAMHESGELGGVFRDHGVVVVSTMSEADTEAEAGSGKKDVGVVSISSGLSTSLSSRLHDLIHSSPVMLFMKGSPEEPKCGFSRKVVEILKQENAEMKSFDILSDEEVRHGLKVYSNWSSYPQLYVKGELIGGSDIVLEMHKSGELSRVLEVTSPTERLNKLITCSPVMLFMKGRPDAPKCGFSSKVVNVLKEAGVEFGAFDILEDDQVRHSLKTYSNWPTYPQLYYKGELIGGCDIIMELKDTGDLKSTLSG